ncbi:unnamed protein product [Urochloa decumbens]|uniref:Uncharacterized protein n=1 Tax=Urochloa decumbens TaxID=240449 RepID=A0ABC8X878_9POAL
MALGDDSNPASYIHTVQHLIEKCMTFGMSMEECMEALAKRADVQPVVTSTGPFLRRQVSSSPSNDSADILMASCEQFAVWKELEKENKEFFDKYKQWISEKRSASSS